MSRARRMAICALMWAGCKSPLGERGIDAGGDRVDGSVPVIDAARLPDVGGTGPFAMEFPGVGRLRYEVVAMIAEDTAVHLIWRDKGYRRQVPILLDGYPDWTDEGAWEEDPDVPGSGPMNCRGGYLVVDDHFGEGIWRDGMGWARQVPLDDSGTPDFAAASWGDAFADELPGSGELRAQTSYVGSGDVLYQEYWRDDRGFARTVPPKMDGTGPDFGNPGPWEELAIGDLPGSGLIHAQTAEVLPGPGVVLERIWREDAGWQRFVPLVSGDPAEELATDWLELSY